MTILGVVFQDEAMASAKPPEMPTSTTAAPTLADYVGKYKFTGLPFEFMEITLTDAS